MGSYFSVVDTTNNNNDSKSSMRNDPNYNLITERYDTINGFGDNRNTAIVIVGNFMKEHNIISYNPQTFTDAELYNILTKQSTLMALLMINNLLTVNNSTQLIVFNNMQLDPNYKIIIDKYHKTFGFKANRNTAIVIVSNFMKKNSITQDVQSFTDKKLYQILTSDSNESAINAINLVDSGFKKRSYSENWSV